MENDSCNTKVAAIKQHLEPIKKYGERVAAIKNFDENVKDSNYNPTPKYYDERCKCGRKIDWYVIGDLYRKGKGEAWSHSCKKLLRAGEGHKELLRDINEVIDSLIRWKEQLLDKGSES